MIAFDFGIIPKQSRLAKTIQGYFQDVAVSDQSKTELRESLDELEILVENRTRRYVETIEQLRKENIQRQKAERLLQKRDAILKAVSYAAEQLMLNHDWQTAAPGILQQLGQATEVGRVYMAQIPVGRDEDRDIRFIEWIAPAGLGRIDRRESRSFFRDEKDGPRRLLQMLSPGKPIWGTLSYLPSALQEIFHTRHVKAVAIIPIAFKDDVGGVLGFDHCVFNHQWSALEIDALKTAANILGAAIQRMELEEVVRKSRARYRAVVDSQNEMICRFKGDGTLTFVNDTFCRYFGEKRQELIGYGFSLFDRQPEQENIMHLLSTLGHDRPAATLEYELIRPGSETKWHKWTIRKIDDGTGNLDEYQAAGWDITDQKRAEQQLQKTYAEQEELITRRTADLRAAYSEMAQKEKMTALGIMTSEVAHEINNPNSFIAFNVPILEDYIREMLAAMEQSESGRKDFEPFGMSFHEFKTDVLKLLQNIHHGSTRINATVTRLRDFASPNGADEQEMVEVKPILERSIELCQAKIKKMVKSLKMDVPEDLPQICINPNVLEQILVNLLINAAQSADKKNSWLRVRVVKKQKKLPKGYVSINVEDNGCGMDENTRQLIFAPFFTTKARGAGTGLGLYISQNLAKGIGGHIRVESKPGKGSCFQVILPAGKHPEQQAS